MIRRVSLWVALALSLCPVTAGAQERIVSLGGSVSEIVAALGASDRLVARDSTTLYPAELQALPDVGYLRALSAEGVLAADPRMILAEADAGPPSAVAALEAAGIPFIRIPAASDPEGVLHKIGAVADALDLPEAGAALAQQVSAGFDRARALRGEVSHPKAVLFVLSVQDGRLMVAGDGTAAAGIITLAGGINAVTGFSGYKPVTDEALLAAAPEAVLMMSHAGDHALSDAELFSHAALAATPAAKRPVIRMDGLLLLGFGPRTPEAAIALHDALYGS